MKYENLNRKMLELLCSDISTEEKAEFLTSAIVKTAGKVLLLALSVGLVVGIAIGMAL